MSQVPVRFFELVREPSQNNIKGTAGVINELTYNEKGDLQTRVEICKTLELDWNNNKKNISCIPKGDYYLTRRKFGKYYTAYKKRFEHEHAIEVVNVLERDAILIHTGNFLKHTKGCILVAEAITINNGEYVARGSYNAYRKLYNELELEKYQVKLNIFEAVYSSIGNQYNEAEFDEDTRNYGDL